jgi:hypothetical protein
MDNQSQTYPIIKSPALRKSAEYATTALLIATIVLALTASEQVAMVSLGVFLMVAAFAASGIGRGLFTHELPWIPMRKTGRIAMFCVGVLSLILGVLKFLHR